MPESLEERFKRFLGSFAGAESIDRLVAGSHETKRRADYLLANQMVIIELKTLKTDTSPKVEKELEKHRGREDFPLIYGAVELQKILRHLHDGEEINQRIYRNVTRSVENAVRSAEEQIRDTRQILQLPASVGVLVLLNESIDVLSPNMVVRKASELLCRKRDDGTSPSPIDFVWLLFESHVSRPTNGLSAFPSVLLERSNAEPEAWFVYEFEQLQQAWARFNNIPLIRSTVKKIEDLPFISANRKQQQRPEKLARHELWRRSYDAAPYLRPLSDEEVLDYGAQAFLKLKPYFLKGGPRTSAEVLEPLFVAWTCFLQESSHRGLDMRKLKIKT